MQRGEDTDEESNETTVIPANKNNTAFGLHPMRAENVQIDPRYPPHFFPFLYPNLYPQMFPNIFPHYAKNFEKVVTKKPEKVREKRNITVVLPDGRNILMNKTEFMAYQLALSQMGYDVNNRDLAKQRPPPTAQDYARSDSDDKEDSFDPDQPDPVEPKTVKKPTDGINDPSKDNIKSKVANGSKLVSNNPSINGRLPGPQDNPINIMNS
jgi:hypothetical protein